MNTNPARFAKYGLTQEDWWALLEAQSGRCAICDKPFGLNRVSVVDHDHLTGRCRGALCHYCNRMLGLLHDNQAWLQRAADYLASPPADRIFDRPRRHIDAPPEESRP